MKEAKDVLPGEILRTTRNPSNGVYYEVPSRITAEDIITRLKRARRDGRDEFLYNQLSQGYVLIRRVRKYYDDDGQPHITSEFVAVPPHYRFETIPDKPGFS